MATSDYLPFATDPSANVATQASYVTDNSRVVGFQKGKAVSTKFNKVWRQASMIAAAVAQVTANKTGVNLADDGNLTNLIAQVTVAMGGLQPAVSSTDKAVVRFSGTTGAIAQNSTLVVSDVGAISGFAANINAQTGTSYTVQAADSGKIVEFNNASAITVTLPNSLPAGFIFTVAQTGAGQVVFVPASGAAIRNRLGYTRLAGQYAGGSMYVTTNGSGASAVYNFFGDGA